MTLRRDLQPRPDRQIMPRYETRCRNAQPVLARLVRSTALEHPAACLRHDADGSRLRARRAAGSPFGPTWRLRDSGRNWQRRYSGLLFLGLRSSAAVPQQPAHRLEEGLAAAQVRLRAEACYFAAGGRLCPTVVSTGALDAVRSPRKPTAAKPTMSATTTKKITLPSVERPVRHSARVVGTSCEHLALATRLGRRIGRCRQLAQSRECGRQDQYEGGREGYYGAPPPTRTVGTILVGHSTLPRVFLQNARLRTSFHVLDATVPGVTTGASRCEGPFSVTVPSKRLAARAAASLQPKPLEHDPEKWEPVFGKDHAQNKKLDHGPDSN